MSKRQSRGRGLRRAIASSLGALLTIAVAASPAFAAVPDAPPAPSVTPGNGQITVTFSAPGSDGGSLITSYTATCTSFNGGATGSVTGGGLVAPIVVTPLTNGAIYVCTVHATNADGSGPESQASAFTTPSTVPSAPAAPVATEGNAQISVAFVPPAANGSPIIGYRARCNSGTGVAGINGDTASPIIVGSLTNGATYTCTVEAINGNGTGPQSVASNAVIVGTPDPPAAPTVTPGNTQISVAISAPANNGSAITSFRASCTGTGPPGTNTGTVSPIVVSGLTNGASYTCTADATNANGTGLESPASAVVIPNPTAPAAPAQPTVTPGNAQIIVTFVPPANNGSAITGYSATCTDGVTPKSNPGTVSPITVTGLTNGHAYTCTVTATNATGTSPASPASLPATPAIAPPSAPAQPTVMRGDTQVVVAFAVPADNGSPITGYTATCTDGVTPKSNPGAVSPIAVTGLTNGVTYTCTVTATSAAGTSAPSPVSLPVIPAPVPNAPARPTVTPHSGSIVVAFTPPVDNGIPVTGYSAACSSANGGAPAAHSGLTSPITVIGLTNAKTYTCTVSAVSANGPSSPSLPSLAAVPATVPAAPTLLAAVSGNAAITVSFTPNSNNGRAITSYKAACTSSNGGAPGLKSGTSSPITVTSLSNGRIYTCKVRATNVVGTSGPSATSTAVLVGTPAPPHITHVVSGIALGSTAGLNVTFDPGPNGGSAASSYRATCNPVGSGVTRAGGRFASPVSVLGLLTGHMYACSVVATNGRGTSAPSNTIRAIVGTPAVPAVKQVLKIANGIVVPFAAPSNNGRSIIDYRARCTSSNGGAASSPLQLASPIVVNNLTPGRSYTCLLAAINARGEGAQAKVGPIVVSATQSPELADCRGGSGLLVASPGVQLDVAQTHTFTLNANLGACTGPYVQSAKVALSFRTTRAISCETAISVPSSGSGTLTWSAPFGLGSSGASLQFTIDSTNGHTTSASYHGTITAQDNLFTNAHVSGSLLLNRGIEGTDIGGDCPTSGRIATFAVTAITMTVS